MFSAVCDSSLQRFCVKQTEDSKRIATKLTSGIRDEVGSLTHRVDVEDSQKSKEAQNEIAVYEEAIGY